jgi:hypothetical protein
LKTLNLGLNIVKISPITVGILMFFSGFLAFSQVPNGPKVMEEVQDAPTRSLSTQTNDPNLKMESKIKTESQTETKKKNSLKPKSKIQIVKPIVEESGNLPPYATRNEPLTNYQSGIVLPQNKTGGEVLDSIHSGDILKCRISQSFKAYENSQIPVRAIVTGGKLKGAILMGTASMDAKTKVVRVNFTELRLKTDEMYTFTGGIFAKSGEELEGEYETHYWKYFWSEALLSATSGYANATVERSKNAYGQYETDNTAENAAKIGVAAGISTTVKELSDRAKSAPEFTKIEGPIFVEVMVLKESRKL